MGQAAPSFTLLNTDGKKVSFNEGHKQRATVAFFCGCNRCAEAATRIASLQSKGVLHRIIAIATMSPTEAREFQRRFKIRGDVLCDSDGSVASAYASTFCPRLWKIDERGIIVFRSEPALEGRQLDVGLAMASQ
jgi:peroxiredoxin